MSAQQNHTTWTAYLSDSAGTVAAGKVLCLNAEGTRYVVSTSANRDLQTLGSVGIAITAGDDDNPAVELQFCGMVPNSITGLGAGDAGPVRVSTTGVLERVASPVDGDEVVGKCDERGDCLISFAGVGDVSFTGGPGPTITNGGTGQLDDVTSTEAGENAAGIAFDGTSTMTVTGFASGSESRMLVVYNTDNDAHLILKHQDSGSASDNQITTPDGEDLELTYRQSAVLFYDAAITNKWRVVGVSSAAAPDPPPTIGGSNGDLLLSDGAGNATGLATGTNGQIIQVVDGLPTYQDGVQVAGSVEAIQVHAAGGGLKGLNPGTVGNVVTNVGGVWTSAAPGGSHEVATFTYSTTGDSGNEVAHAVDVSAFEDGVYDFILRIRGDAGDAGGAVHFFVAERRFVAGIRDGEIVSYGQQIRTLTQQYPDPSSITLVTVDASFHEALGASLDIYVRGEAATTLDWSGEVEMRRVEAVNDAGGWGGASGAFDPASLDLSGWWRTDFGASPWVGTASAGVSGGREMTEGTNPPATGSALNGHVPADFDGTNDRLKALTTAATVYDNFILDSAFTFVVLFRADSAEADAGDANSYANPCLLSDASNDGGIGIAYSDSGVRGWIYASGNWTSTAVAAPTATWQAVQVKYDGTTLKTRINRGSWTSQARGHVSFGSMNAQPAIGRDYAGTKFFDGKIAEVMISGTTISDGNLDSILDYMNARYALSL